MLRNMLLPLSALLALALAGCGGGGGAGAPPPTKAVISFALVATQPLPYNIGGVEVDSTLPAGVSVTTADSGGPRRQLLGIEAGSAVTAVTGWQGVFGSYSAPAVRLVVADGSQANLGFAPGEIFRLTCGVAPGTVISESERLALEQRVTFQAFGHDPSGLQSSLNDYLRPAVTVSYLP